MQKKDVEDFDIEKVGKYPKFLGVRVSAIIEIILFHSGTMTRSLSKIINPFNLSHFF